MPCPALSSPCQPVHSVHTHTHDNYELFFRLFYSHATLLPPDDVNRVNNGNETRTNDRTKRTANNERRKREKQTNIRIHSSIILLISVARTYCIIALNRFYIFFFHFGSSSTTTIAINDWPMCVCERECCRCMCECLFAFFHFRKSNKKNWTNKRPRCRTTLHQWLGVTWITCN